MSKQVHNVKGSKRLPVTLLSGFLGAGKTTLLKHILESNQHKQKIAVIVNDMAEINIDGSLIEKNKFVQAKQEIVQMQNGCICCTLRTDLIREINRIRSSNSIDYLIIESTGIAEPMQVAESFCADINSEEIGEDIPYENMLINVAKLDTCVTVIDSQAFNQYSSTIDSFIDHFALEATDEEEGEKNISTLLIEQVEFANVIIVNKVDLISENQLSDLLKTLKSLNPKAKIIPTSYSKVNLSEIMNTNLFNLEEAKSSPGWLQSLKEKHNPETLEYGINSFVYKARKPFHPIRLNEWIQNLFYYQDEWKQLRFKQKIIRQFLNNNDNLTLKKLNSHSFGTILRSKGFIWIAGRDKIMGEWEQSGKLIDISPIKYWYSEEEDEENFNSLTKEEQDYVKKDFIPIIGDHRQEIVFIGTNLNAIEITNSLNNCLLTDDEMISHLLDENNIYNDPLPLWMEEISYDNTNALWNSILTPFKKSMINIHSNTKVIINSITLNTINEDKIIYKVWLKYDSNKIPILLCSLSSTSPNISLNIELPGDENPIAFFIEESYPKKRNFPSENNEYFPQVHLLGIVSKQVTEEEEEDDDEEEHEHNKKNDEGENLSENEED